MKILLLVLFFCLSPLIAKASFLVTEPSLGVTLQFVSMMKVSTEISQADEMNRKINEHLPNIAFHDRGLGKYSPTFLSKHQYHFFGLLDSPFTIARRGLKNHRKNNFVL